MTNWPVFEQWWMNLMFHPFLANAPILYPIKTQVNNKHWTENTWNIVSKWVKDFPNVIINIPNLFQPLSRSWSCLCRAKICVFNVNNRNIRNGCEIFSKLTIKTSERRQWRRSGFLFILNIFHIFFQCFIAHCWHWTCPCLLGVKYYFC